MGRPICIQMSQILKIKQHQTMTLKYNKITGVFLLVLLVGGILEAESKLKPTIRQLCRKYCDRDSATKKFTPDCVYYYTGKWWAVTVR